MAKPGLHVALLRGINVGGKNKLPMKTLTAIVEDAGLADVRTYIQSGNVVFGATKAQATRASEDIGAGILEQMGFTVPVVVRSAADMRALAKQNPFLPECDPATLHVGFLADKPAAKAVRGLDPERSPGDRFEVRGREIFLHCPNGLTRTKLSNAWFDRSLDTVTTVRNWKTVSRLVEMLA